MDVRNILITLSFSINLLLAVILHLKTEKNHANTAFKATVYAIAGWCLSMVLYRATSGTIEHISAVLLYFFPTFVPTGFLIFGLYFHEKKVDLWKIYTIVTINILMALITVLDGLVIQKVVSMPTGEKHLLFGIGYYAYFLYIPAFFTLSYFVLLKKFLKANPLIKTQLFYIILGVTFASAPAMLTNLILPTLGYFELNWVGQVCTFIWIAFTSYAIIKHRLFGISFFIGQVLHGLLLAAIPFTVFYGIYYIQTSLWGSIFTPMSYISGFIFALLFTYILIHTNKLLKRIIYRTIINQGMDFSEARSALSKRVNTQLILSNITHTALDIIDATILCKFSGIFLTSEPSNKITYQTTHNFNFRKQLQEWDMFPHYWKTNNNNEPLIFEELQDIHTQDMVRQILAFMKKEKLKAVFPLFINNEVKGFIFLGQKQNNTAYSIEDVNFLKSITSLLSIAIGRALLYQKVDHFNKTLQQKVDEATKKLQDAYAKLQKQYEDLQLLDQLKDEFLSITSHDLRTPLTIIRNNLWMILNRPKQFQVANPQTISYLNACYESSERLIRLVKNTLTVTHIESGSLSIHLSIQSIEPIIDEVADEMRQFAKNKGIHFLYEKTKTTILPLSLDKDRIKEVCINLLDNAINYTPQGGTVTLLVEGTNSEVQIAIRDTGKGISKENIARLFKKFGRIESSLSVYSAAATGTGLGLYISKQLIELHHGSIHVESSLGSGSTFTITLPIHSHNKGT
ncbi:hypothetical protein KAZ66_02335 [Candidatus Woesebacteria bacterium]|nr:hypothetical protein [Candidatus Woesebacteria bacterium]